MRIISITTLLVMALTTSLNAQTKNKISDNQVWLAYMNQTRLSNKWGFWAEAQLRTKEDFFSNFSTGIARVGLTYYVNDNTKITAGYGYVHHFSTGGNQRIDVPEHRPWQQIQWHTKYGGNLRVMQYARLEQRYRRKLESPDKLADGYHFNWRARYSFLLQGPIGAKPYEPGTFSWILNDEIHINFGEQIVNNYFDQNRFFAGFAFHTTKSDQVQFGYLNQFIQLPEGNSYRTNHIARVAYFHNLDLRKK
ncbi:DUF2490 domain-containing protein [Pseudoflavitalea rhizosphaerae]|uniref:DUF2490 domain-containing protein n=1 Tax=Pseudoflavitalea rhizosphaerae TaxID=1884793 RepID=UPI000F8F5673|nr:DUF2490 domain-containing protein [Pseudoflavitalea rhizosphaerae]